MSLAAAGVPIQFSASIDVNNFFVPVLEGITLESLSSNFPLTAFKIKTVPQKAFLFNITGSISGFNVASSGATSLSGSVQLIKRSGTDTILEEGIFIKQLADTIEGGSGQFNFSTTSSLAFNDLVYLKIIGLGNGSTPRNPSAFTASLNSFKITSEPTGSSKELVVEPYLTSPFYGTDCDVTYGNASQPVSNPFLQDIDYGDGVIIPINNAAIINNTATKGTVPESFFTVKSILNPTYESVNTVSEYNKEESAFTTQVSSGVFVAYFDSYQTLQQFNQEKYQTRFNFKYLITPEEELIEISNDPTILYTLLYNFGTNANPNTTYDFISTGGTDTNHWGQIDGSIKLRATTFSTGSFDTSGDANPLEWKGDYRNFLYQGNIQGIAYTTGSVPGISGSASEFQNVGGILFPASIGLTSAAELPSKAKEILAKNNIITPSNTTS
jgi:hypothetical protein